MLQIDPEAGFAAVYDVIYAGSPAAFEAQCAFLTGRLGAARSVLDAGCGPGRHLAALARGGFEAWGLDVSLPMLRRARATLAGAGLPARLARGQLQALPFAAAGFDGALCLESPLAYLLSDAEFGAALAGLRRVLRPGGRLVIDVYDYLAAFGPRGARPQRAQFAAAWGHVEVTESHRYNRQAATWHMTQRFGVTRGDRVGKFTVEHRLRVRPADAYAHGLERAGFEILELWPGYPQGPDELRRAPRLIFVAQAA